MTPSPSVRRPGCVFCDRDGLRRADVYHENDHFVYASTRDPRDPPDVLPGSGIAVPLAHRASPFDFSSAEWVALGDVLVEAKAAWDERLAPDGYFLSWACFPHEGAAIADMHAHLHVVPRFDDEPFSDRVLRIAARFADRIHSMTDVQQAQTKVDVFAREAGRDPADIRWSGGGWLFLHDDPDIRQRALDAAMQQYGESEETIRKHGFVGSVEEVRAGVRRQIELGLDEIVVFQLPRIHRPSLMRFSEDVIPHFT